MSQQSLNLQHLFNLEGKVALITGGSRGIGYMMAQGLLEAGARVYISARNADNCQQAAQKLSQFGTCMAIPADVSDDDSRLFLLNRLQQHESKLDILINNAGTSWGDEYETYPLEAFNKLMNINVISIFALTRDLTPMLSTNASKDEPARVINIGSIDGLHIPTAHGVPTFAYTTSKAALHQLSQHLAVELAPKCITVNTVAPGVFPTKMTEKSISNNNQAYEKNALLARLGKPEEIAGIIIYLCSKAGAYTHGTIIPVDGGTLVNHNQVRTG